MNKIRKILSLLLIQAIILSATIFNISAEEGAELSWEQVNATQKISLMSNISVYDFEYTWDEVITRIDFAQMMTRLINFNTDSYQPKNLYDDVNSEIKGYIDVSLMKDLSVMNGKAERLFYPDANLTVNEALASVIRLLGYTAEADAKGGYPTGYRSTANRLELLKDVSYEGCKEGITAGALAVILYNALDVEMVDSYYFEDNNMTVSGNGEITLAGSYLGLTKATGLVSGYDVLSLLQPLKEQLEYNEVQIDGKTYLFDVEEMESFLGYQTEYFYKEAQKGQKYPTIVFAQKEASSEEITIKGNEIKSADSTGIKCKEKYNNGKTYKIASDAMILKNGYPVSKMAAEYIPENGYIKMISNEGNAYDVVMIFDFESFVVMSSARGEISFEYGLTLDGMQLVDLSDDSKLSTVIYDGEVIDPEEIKKGDAISIAYDKNFGYYAIISRKTTSGPITSMSGTPLEIGINEQYDYVNTYLTKVSGETYGIDAEFKRISDASLNGATPLAVGIESDFTIDFFGNICGMGKAKSSQNYGYLYGAIAEDALSDVYSVRMLSNVKNGWSDYYLADNCTLNGVKTDGGEIVKSLNAYVDTQDANTKLDNLGKIGVLTPPIVKFELDNNGKIKNIVNNMIEGNDPTKISEDTIVLSKPYYLGVYQSGYDRFTEYSESGLDGIVSTKQSAPIAYGGDAVCFQVPADKEKLEDYKVGTPQSVMPKDYNVPRPYIYYDLNEYGVPGLVIYVPAEGGSSIRTDTAVYGVTGIAEGVDCVTLELIDAKGSEARYTTTYDEDLIAKCRSFKRGDFVQISLSSKNELVAVEKFFSYDVNDFDSAYYSVGGGFEKRMKDTNSPEGYGIGLMRVLESKYVASTTGTNNSGTVLRFDHSGYPYSQYKATNVVIYDGTEYYASTVDAILPGDLLLFRIGQQAIGDVFVFRNSGFTDETVYLTRKLN